MSAVPLPDLRGRGRPRASLPALFGFAALYVSLAHFGEALINPMSGVTPVWPAAGLALAALLHWGPRRVWPALLVGALIASWVLDSSPPLVRVGAVSGGFCGPLVGAWMVERLANGRRFPESPQGVLGFMLAGAGSMGVVSATLGSLGLGLGGEVPWGQLSASWVAWCVSDQVGAILLTPALLAWSAPALRGDGAGPARKAHAAGEVILLVLVFVLGTQVTFGAWPFPPHHRDLQYFCAPALLWAAFRFPYRGVATAAVALGVLGIFNTLQGIGPFAAPLWSGQGESLLHLQMFLASTVGMVLATAAVVRERRAQAAALEEIVVQRTGEIRAELGERVRAEGEAQANRVMLRRIIDMLPQAVWWKDRAGVYLGCNGFVVESVGFSSPEELIGKTDAELPWRFGLGEFFRAADERVMSSGKPELRMIYRQDFPDGRSFTLESSQVALRDADGQVVGVLGTSEDITARERTEAELRAVRADLETRVAARTADLARANESLKAGEDRFRRAILDAPIPIMLVADDGEVLSVNHAWVNLTGYRHEQIPTTNHWIDRAYPPEQRGAIREVIRETYGLEHAREVGEFQITTADGSQRVWDFSSAPLGRLPDGRRMVIYSAKDVTTRRRDEDAKREGEQRLRLAFQAGKMGFWRTDLRKGVTEWDEQVQRLNGWEPGTFPGNYEAFLSRVHPEDVPAVVEAGRHVVEQRREFTLSYRVVWPDQSVHWLEDRGRPDLDDDGLPIALTGVTMDVTKQRESEDALRAAKAEAERANTAKSEFLSRMSHELRTPLNAILGFGQLLEVADLEARHVQSVEHILRAGRHLLALIDEVLDIARIESGQLTLVFEPVRAAEVMTETVNLLRPLAARYEVRVHPGEMNGHLRADASSTHVLADRQRLKQVLLNLLSNAIKYNRAGGEVFVACGPAPGRRIFLEVRDTGRGLAPEDLGRLFTPFERFGAEREGVEGTGIGLVIARRLIESMGGTIRVESTHGKGSTFRVELSCAAPSEDTLQQALTGPDDNVRPAEDVSPSAASLATHTVLYIEDNLSNLQLIERIFERRSDGQRVALLSAMQGGLGLDLAQQHRPDLVLLDLQLPDISGEEVLARLRMNLATRDIPVIILSADATTRQREKLLGAGALAYLTKPLDVPRFLELVNRTLGGCAA